MSSATDNFRINEEMIAAAVIERLKGADIRVIAADIVQGFERNCAAVWVYPSSCTLINSETESITDEVTIVYYPKKPLRLVSLRMGELIRRLFLYYTLDVGERKFTIENIGMDIDAEYQACVISFNVDYMQPIPDDEDEDEYFEHLSALIENEDQ